MRSRFPLSRTRRLAAARGWTLVGLAAALLAAGALSGCGEGESRGPTGTRAPAVDSGIGGTSQLTSAIRAAARETGVPAEVLATVAFIESRFSPTAAGDADHGLPGVGLMQLVPGDGPRSLEIGARLARVDVETARRDAVANLRAGAYLLAEIGTRLAARSDDLSSWHRVLVEFAGGGEVGRPFAEQVFAQLRQGFRAPVPAEAGGGYLVVSAKAHALPQIQFRRSAARPDYPQAEWIPSPNFSSRNGTHIDTIVIHTTQGSFGGAVSWFQQTRSQVSAHYVVRSSDGHVVQMVEEQNNAWHASCWNRRSIGIEHEGFVEDPGRWYTDAMYESSARLVRYLCDKYGIPCDRAHVKGHGELTDCNTHTDPGRGWDWDRFMALVNGRPAGPPLAASYVGQSATHIDLRSGEEVVAWVEYKNDGTRTWDTTNTRLGTTMPKDRESVFIKDENWISPNRPTAVDARTPPGAVGRFSFVFLAPMVTEPTTFVEHVALVQEGDAWFGPPEDQVYFTINVLPPEGTTPPAEPTEPSEPAEPTEPTRPTGPTTQLPEDLSPAEMLGGGTQEPGSGSSSGLGGTGTGGSASTPTPEPTTEGGVTPLRDYTGGCTVSAGAPVDASMAALLLLGLLLPAQRRRRS